MKNINVLENGHYRPETSPLLHWTPSLSLRLSYFIMRTLLSVQFVTSVLIKERNANQRDKRLDLHYLKNQFIRVYQRTNGNTFLLSLFKLLHETYQIHGLFMSVLTWPWNIGVMIDTSFLFPYPRLPRSFVTSNGSSRLRTRRMINRTYTTTNEVEDLLHSFSHGTRDTPRRKRYRIPEIPGDLLRVRVVSAHLTDLNVVTATWCTSVARDSLIWKLPFLFLGDPLPLTVPFSVVQLNYIDESKFCLHTKNTEGEILPSYF